MADQSSSRRVGARLELQVHASAELVLQLAVTRASGMQVDEDLQIQAAGVPVDPAQLDMAHGGRAHLLRVGQGLVTVKYRPR